MTTDWCEFSPDRVYRYTLWRVWDASLPYVQFIGLNPSTADETNDDPTIRRCIRFARDWGYGALCMTNAFAFRATDPSVMKTQQDPIGPDNDAWLCHTARKAAIVVAAWGVHGTHRNRNRDLQQLLHGRLHCLSVTAKGQPKHPLYLRADLLPVRYS